MTIEKLRNHVDLFIRIPVGFHLIYGVFDNIISWDRMLEFKEFLALHHFPLPLLCAILSVYAQFICGILFMIGWKIRYAAMLMIFNFVVAILMVHVGDPYPNVFPAIMMLSASIYLFLKYSD